MSAGEQMSIGELARATGVSVSAIRYYEQQDLVSPIGREGGKRRFGVDAVDRLRFVSLAKHAGFTLEQIGGLLNDSTSDAREVIACRLEELKQARADLDRAITFLEAASTCGCENLPRCAMASEG